MNPALPDHIRRWAAARDLPLTGHDSAVGKNRLWLLEGGFLVGELRVLQVQPDPPTFLLSVMSGNMVLDESWADMSGLDACLDLGMRLLKERVKNAAPSWHLHLGDLPE